MVNIEQSIEKYLVEAQNGNTASREEIIQRYHNFILQTASRVCKRKIHWKDDEASISLIAFNEAIDRYKEVAGKSFENYAQMLIHSRLVDEFRKKNKHSNEFLMNKEDETLELNCAEIVQSLEAYKREKQAEELSAELADYDLALQGYGINLEELEECSPCHRDTRFRLIQIARQFILYPAMIEYLCKNRQLPLKEMVKSFEVNRRVLERNRKFLISLILIYCCDEFSLIRSTVSFEEEGG